MTYEDLVTQAGDHLLVYYAYIDSDSRVSTSQKGALSLAMMATMLINNALAQRSEP